jgi:branched-chain amino acid transport system substrate-binding protein
MRKWWMFAAACLWMMSSAPSLVSQSSGQNPSQNLGQGSHVCACGAHPPAPPRDRTVTPYAGEPEDMSPFAKFAAPYSLDYIHPNIYMGAGRDIPEPKNLSEVRIGFIGPIANGPEQTLGLRMLHGAQLAVEEANARGGYGGKPFRLMLHNDYNNWQANAAYSEERPTDPAIWGAASNEAVQMIYGEQDWAIFGSISSESTHVMLRLALKAEIPIVNSASTDPTIPETYIPWYFTDLQDDRVQCFTLARRIYSELGLRRVAILRVNNRYGRLGVPKFRDAARRLGHPVVIEQKFVPGDSDFTRELQIIRDSRADAIVLWADEAPAAQILKQMRALGMKQRVFGSYRTLGPELLAEAGPAAEGFEAVFPYDPTRNDPLWLDFNRRFEARFYEPPEQFAALAYDAMNVLLDAICEAGLNRARIHDALADLEQYDGVTGHMIFDPNQKNVAPMYLGTVHDGAITYRPASMSKTPARAQAPAPLAASLPIPYARVGEDGEEYVGPHSASLPAGPEPVIVFGRGAAQIVQKPEVLSVLGTGSPHRPGLSLLPVESAQNWGTASTQLVHALMDTHALAILALDRDSAHLAEQLALKCFVPVVALSNDRSLTSANVPWIFRLPGETTPAAALRVIREAAVRAGANPERVRNVLASGNDIAGMAFLPTGEPRGH